MRIKRGWAALRDNRRGGLALIAALCAAAVLLGLAMSLLYSSSLVLARANRKTGQERVYQLAKTFDSTLNYELTRYNTDKDGHKLGASDEKQSPETGGTLYDFVNQFLDRDVYAAYNADNPSGTSYYYTLEGNGDADYGKPRIRLRKEVPSEAEDPTTQKGEFSYDDSASQTTALESAEFIRYTVEVCSEVETEDGTYAYSTEYYRKDRYKPLYMWNGEESGEKPVYWVDGAWYADQTVTTQCVPAMKYKTDEAGNIVEDGLERVTISYEYALDKVTYKTYVPTASSSESAGGADPSGSGSGSGGEGG